MNSLAKKKKIKKIELNLQPQIKIEIRRIRKKISKICYYGISNMIDNLRNN